MQIDEAITAIRTNQEKQRYAAFQFLLPISEENPETIYAYWDIFVEVLRMKAVANQFVAIPIIANLVKADTGHRFDVLFDEFYENLQHESPVVSPHIARVSGIILKARPDLQDKILNLLLTTDQTSQCRHKELLKSYVIEGLDEAFDVLNEKSRVIEYVKNQLNSDSPKTKKKAKEFLNKRAKGNKRISHGHGFSQRNGPSIGVRSLRRRIRRTVSRRATGFSSH